MERRDLLNTTFSAVLLLATASVSGESTPLPDADLTDQQEGMQENLGDSVAENAEPTELEWLSENIRMILPENLQDMHRMEVRIPGKPDDSGTTDDSAGQASSTSADSAEAPDSEMPVVIEKSDQILEWTRKPLTLIQERIPFLTKRNIIFFGRLEPEAMRYSSGVLEDDSGFQVRRFRVGLAGRVAAWPSWNYKLELDLTDGENTLSDAYLSWYSHKWGTVRFGNQKVAQTLSGQTSSISIPFMERPLPVLAFTLGRRLGVGYDLHRSRAGINATVFATDLNENIGNQGYAVRGYYNPARSDIHILHIGASFMQFSSDNDAQIRARPESNKTDTRLINTGVYPDVDTASATGLELAGAWGPVTIRSEFYQSAWGGKDSSRPKFDGWYAEGTWFLTGEMSRYREGKFIRSHIRKNSGAWELALRYSTTDLNDKEVEGGWEDNLSFGVNWYSKLHWRVMSNAIKVDSEGPLGEQDPWIIQTRVQYYF